MPATERAFSILGATNLQDNATPDIAAEAAQAVRDRRKGAAKVCRSGVLLSPMAFQLPLCFGRVTPKVRTSPSLPVSRSPQQSLWLAAQMPQWEPVL